MTASIGFTIRHTPYGTNHAHEAVDAIMACSVYGHPIHVFFMHDGVFCLTQQSRTQELQFKNIAKQLNALPLYGVEHVFACKESLDERNIDVGSLPDHIRVLATDELKKALATQQHLLSF